MHKTVVCECGKRISTCRCPGPKVTVVSDKPCTHKVAERKTPEEKIEAIYQKYADSLNLPVWVFKEVIMAYNKEMLAATMEQARDNARRARGADEG